MHYEDFEIGLGPIINDEYVLSVRSLEGDQNGTFRLPFDEQTLAQAMLVLENSILRSAAAEAARGIDPDANAAVQEFGRKLYEAVFLPAVRSLFDRTVTAARQRHCGVRLKFRIVSAELSAIPWEFLYDPGREEYFCRQSSTPVVRYVLSDHPVSALRVQPPLRILGLAASPSGYPPLAIEQEKARVEQALRELIRQRRVELAWLERGTWRELQDRLREGTWHVLHFIGHGGFDPAREKGLLLLQGDASAEAYLLAASDLGSLLRERSLRFVLLNCCESARASARDIFSSTATTLVKQGIPAVLAMQYRISDRAAIEFSRSFYAALADYVPVDAAVADARLAIKLSLPDSIEWATPVLFTHSRDEALFASDIVKPPPIEQPVEPPRVSDESTKPDDAVKEPAQEPPPPPPASSSLSTEIPDLPPPLLPTEWYGPDVPVRLLIAVGDPALRGQVHGMRGELTRDRPVYETKQTFCFTWEGCEPAGVEAALRRFVDSTAAESLVIVVSDVLAERDKDGPGLPGPSVTTTAIRDLFEAQAKLCGLVAIVPSSRRRAHDIEAVVDPQRLAEMLPSVVLRTADALRLKAPPGPTVALDDNEAIVVRLARNDRDMRECLGLRFLVYDRLGYLDERVSRCPAGLDLDCYDNRAIQFLAETVRTGDVVGTVRLLLPQPLSYGLSESIIGSPPRKTVEIQAKICKRIADEEAGRGGDELRRKLDENPFAPLPILQSNDFRRRTAEMLAGAQSQTELSRLVVRPHYRGLGISRLLIRAAIAVAHDLRRGRVLLECVPAHAAMYMKFGFQRIPGRHGRVQDLDQTAVAMKLELTNLLLDPLASLTKRDLAMIRSEPRDPAGLFGRRSHLCLCNQKGCWSRGSYSFTTQRGCPLRELHLRNDVLTS
jgi:GNAT superfamily N-acetyltransferase